MTITRVTTVGKGVLTASSDPITRVTTVSKATLTASSDPIVRATVVAKSVMYSAQVPPDYNKGTVKKNKKNPGGGVPIPEAEYTATQSFVNEKNDTRPGKGAGRGKSKGQGKGVDVIIKLPDQPGTFDLTCHIEGYDFGSGIWYNILSGSNITAGDTTERLTVGPFISDVVNQSANDALPYRWRVRVEHGDATAVTYSAEYKLY